MRSRTILTFVLASAMGLCAFPAGGKPGSPTADDPKSAKKVEEKKVESLLTRLVSQCQKMLARQTAVLDATRALHKLIDNHADQQPRPMVKLLSAQLALKQKAIIAEAMIATDLLKEERVAFPEIFDQLRADMQRVQSRLEKCNVGLQTQAIAMDIIETLKDMLGK